MQEFYIMATEDRRNIWEEEHCKGIRIKCLKNLMFADQELKIRYNQLDKDKPDALEYLKSFNRIDDIAKILNCSHRTARDYRDTLIYFSRPWFEAPPTLNWKIQNHQMLIPDIYSRRASCPIWIWTYKKTLLKHDI